MVNLKKMMAIVLMLSVILMAGCSTSEPQDDTQNNNDFVPDDNGAEDTPIEPVTGEVVAVVNGEDITSEEVSAVQQSYQQQGQQLSEQEAIDQVINQKVLEQKVQEEEITVTTEEAESAIEQQLTMQGMTLDDYKQQVESQGLSYEEELENVKEQIATQKYLEIQLEGEEFEVTDEEAQEFYEMYKAQSPEEVPPFEELESQIIASLEQEKQQEAINLLIEDLKEDAEIEYK